jgi:hypothetical protein
MAKQKPFRPAKNLTETYNAVNPDLPLEPGGLVPDIFTSHEQQTGG